MPTPLQAIVFDYDGVLADTESLHLEAFQASLVAHGVDLTRRDYFARYLGLDDQGVFDAIALDRGLGWGRALVEGLVADKTSRFREFLRSGRAVLYSGVSARLRAWSDAVAFAIASGSTREEIEPVLQAAGLRPLFDVIVGAGDTASGKPAPDPYLRALALLADRQADATVDPAHCVAVEDSPWGIDSAHGAGLSVVALATSYPASELGSAELVVGRFEDLTLDLLNQVAGRWHGPRGL